MLGATIKTTGINFMLNNQRFGYFKRVHKGEADILAHGKIKEFLQTSGDYWQLLVKYKDDLKTILDKIDNEEIPTDEVIASIS